MLERARPLFLESSEDRFPCAGGIEGVSRKGAVDDDSEVGLFREFMKEGSQGRSEQPERVEDEERDIRA